MEPKNIKPGVFYINTKQHHVYLANNNLELTDLTKGTVLLPPYDPEVNPRAWRFLRPAINDEIIRALNSNPNFLRNNINDPIT